MDSEARIIEVVLGTEFSDYYERRTGDDKTRPENWCLQAVRTESLSKHQFGSLFFTPFMTLKVDSRPRVNESASVIKCK